MVRLFKRLVCKSYVLFLMAFTVWYGYFMYPLIFGFEGKEQAEASLRELGDEGSEAEQMFLSLIAEQTATKKTDLGYRVIEQPYIEGRFHHVGFEIQPDNASICVRCHGNVPHHSSKEVRSFLNMHAFYLACETCHVTPEKDKPAWDFRWYDKATGEVADNPIALIQIEDLYKTDTGSEIYPTYGNYGAKIAPGETDYGPFKFLHGTKEKTFVERYIGAEHQLGAKEKSQMKRVIHTRVGNKPVQCKQCHRKDDAYLPFEELGYPPRRVAELSYTSVVGMIDKYNEFYIPSFLTPGGE